VTTETYRSRGPAEQPPHPDHRTSPPHAVARPRGESFAAALGAAGESTAATVPTIARRAKRQNVALLVTASLLGLWLGTAAPDISPAAPAATLPTASAATLPTTSTASTDPALDDPAIPVEPDRIGNRGGRR
jgi:hypothetical protein